MEALILSCSTGGGHNAAGQAITDELNLRGWKTHFFDPYTLLSQKTADRVGDSYVSLVRFSPALFGDVYKLGELYLKAEKAFGLPDPVLAVQAHTAKALYAWLQANPVDIVICTQPYPGLMLTWLARHGYPVPPSIMVPTDYTCIPFECDVNTTWMTLPYPALADEFHAEGVACSRLIPTGIPINPVFSRPLSRQQAAQNLGLDASKRYILIGGGSMGTNGIYSILKELVPLLESHEDLEALVLCASNQGLEEQITHARQPHVHPLGFTHQMVDYLHLCSVYITKPGGLSITEASACNTPLLLANPIPGCESANAEFFEHHNLALYARSSADIRPLTEKLLARPLEGSSKPSWFADNTKRLADWIECAVMLNEKIPASPAQSSAASFKND